MSFSKLLRPRLLIVLLLFAGLSPVGGSGGLAQAQEEEAIVCIARVNVHRLDEGVFSQRVDFRVQWRVFLDGDKQPIETYDSYEICCSLDDSTFTDNSALDCKLVPALDTASFLDKRMGVYYLRVKAFMGGELRATSDPFIFSADRLPLQSTHGLFDYWYSPAYYFLWALDRLDLWKTLDTFDRSTPLGQRAFDLITLFLFLGMLLGIVALRRMRSIKLFPIDKTVHVSGKDGAYNECEMAVRLATNNQWGGGDKDRLLRLVKGKLSGREFQGQYLGRIDSLLRSGRTLRRRRKQKEVDDIPAVRILSSMVSAARTPADIEKAIETRISAEEEDLRKRSYIDWLWAIGVTAPLIGLFGTVTGISASFRSIVDRSMEGYGLMSALARGIFEALHTTIFGLIVSILFMLAYYYYSYKLDRISAVWAMFSAEFLDEFKYSGSVPRRSGNGSRRSGGGRPSYPDRRRDDKRQ